MIAKPLFVLLSEVHMLKHLSELINQAESCLENLGLSEKQSRIIGILPFIRWKGGWILKIR